MTIIAERLISDKESELDGMEAMSLVLQRCESLISGLGESVRLRRFAGMRGSSILGPRQTFISAPFPARKTGISADR